MTVHTCRVFSEADARYIRDSHRLRGGVARILPERDEHGRFVVETEDRREKRSPFPKEDASV